MNFKSLRNTVSVLAIFSVLASVVFVGCKKDPEPTVVEIRVRDIDGFRVPGAKVDLYAEQDEDLVDSLVLGEERFPKGELVQYTDTAGVARFDLTEFRNEQIGSDGFSVMDLLVEKDGFETETVVQVTEYQTAIKVVQMRCSCFR